MTDAVVLLALSQIICLAGLAYLYLQLQGVRGQLPRLRAGHASRVRYAGTEQAAAQFQAPAPTPAPVPVRPGTATSSFDAGAITARMAELGVDVAALARRMGRSEEEVRLMLRRQGASR